MIWTQQFVDAEPRYGGLGPNRFKPGDGKIDAVGMTFADQVAQDLRRGEIDLDNPGRLQHQQPRRLLPGLQGVEYVAPEMIGIEERQRCLESRDANAGFLLAGKIGADRTP